MSLTKQIYDREKLYDISDLEYYEKLLYMEGYVNPKSSLNYGGDLDLTLHNKSKSETFGVSDYGERFKVR
jgi:hypothetical protein